MIKIILFAEVIENIIERLESCEKFRVFAKTEKGTSILFSTLNVTIKSGLAYFVEHCDVDIKME
jgi:hypothetical protein